jgi:hypothetical protein
VTGSQDEGETLVQTAIAKWPRDRHRCHPSRADRLAAGKFYEIYRSGAIAMRGRHQHRARIRPAAAGPVPVTLHPREHLQHVWLPVESGAAVL